MATRRTPTESLESQIEKLEKATRKEKQPRKKYDMFRQLFKLREQKAEQDKKEQQRREDIKANIAKKQEATAAKEQAQKAHNARRRDIRAAFGMSNG